MKTTTILAVAALVGGVALIVVGAEVFAEHLEGASRRLGVSVKALRLYERHRLVQSLRSYACWRA